MLIQRYLWVLVLMVPFEIRDLKFDSSSMGTLPQQLGTRGVKWFGVLMLLMIVLLMSVKQYNRTCDLVIERSMVVLMLIFLYKPHPHPHERYSSFYVEGLPTVWWLLSLMFC